MYQYSSMAPRLSGQTSIFGVVFSVLKCLLELEGEKAVAVPYLELRPGSRGVGKEVEVGAFLFCLFCRLFFLL